MTGSKLTTEAFNGWEIDNRHALEKLVKSRGTSSRVLFLLDGITVISHVKQSQNWDISSYGIPLTLFIHKSLTFESQNTTWDIDIKLGVMKQPGGLGAPHPLWEPKESKDVPDQIKAWRKNVARLPDLPELDDLLKEFRGEDAEEAEEVNVGYVGEGEGMSGVEAGHGEGLAGEPAVELDDEGRSAKRPRLK